MYRSRSGTVSHSEALHKGANLTHLAATSNDPWGPTGSEMSEIAALTFNKYVYHTRDLLLAD